MHFQQNISGQLGQTQQFPPQMEKTVVFRCRLRNAHFENTL